VKLPTTDSKTVLIVDNDKDLLDLLAFVLSAEGYDVETASDGREALGAVEKGMPKLILLDMKMPVMNGWEFAEEFHERYDDKAPIVVVTAAENAGKRAEEIRANGWISKPFDVGTLIDVVRRQLATV
jgi:CheY-like chemotaxis protein